MQETDDAYLQADAVAVAPKIQGYVEQIYVRDNQAVTAGDILLELDPRDHSVGYGGLPNEDGVVELDAEGRLQLARTFAQELAERHNVAVDLAVHAPKAEGDPRNHHAHLLVTTREVGASGLGAKAGLDMHSDERRRRGLPHGFAAVMGEIKALRERWAVLSNEAFAAAGLAVRIDHRSLRDQGIDREPAPHIPFAAFQIERRGQHSPIAHRLRERYRERVQARLAHSQGMDLETVRRQAREAWLKLREQAASPLEQQRSAAAEQQRSAAAIERDAADQDLSL